MFIVMGATGNVGRAVAKSLLSHGQPVTILTRHPEAANEWRNEGANVIQADAEDVDSMRAAFRTGQRAFLLNPPAAPETDTDATELRTARNIIAALDGCGLEKVVAASTYGARPGSGIGDLTTLWELEEGLRRQPIPAAINRGAFYMSNWTTSVDVVRRTGKVSSMFPSDCLMPMVAPEDLGIAAASRLLAPVTDTNLWYVEGPRRYTPHDIAIAFGTAMGKEITVEVTPRDQWKTMYKNLGFSDEGAKAYTRMTATSFDEGFFSPEHPHRGTITLQEFVQSRLTLR